MKKILTKVAWVLLLAGIPLVVALLLVVLLTAAVKMRWTHAVSLAFLAVGLFLVVRPLLVKVIEFIKSVELTPAKVTKKA